MKTMSELITENCIFTLNPSIEGNYTLHIKNPDEKLYTEEEIRKVLDKYLASNAVIFDDDGFYKEMFGDEHKYI